MLNQAPNQSHSHLQPIDFIGISQVGMVFAQRIGSSCGFNTTLSIFRIQINHLRPYPPALW